MTITVIGNRTAEVIVGLNSFAAFLKDHPDLPLGFTDPLRHSVRAGNDDDNRAEVNRIAEILGVTPRDPFGDGATYEARRDFGGGIAYIATAVSRQFRDRWNDHWATFHEAQKVAA